MKAGWRYRIGTRLVAGFGIVAFLAALLGMIAMVQMSRLADLTAQMYDHPLIVSRAVGDIQTNIVSIHRSMKDLVLSKTEPAQQAAIEALQQQEQQALDSFEIVRKRFLGDPEMVEKTRRCFINWRPIRQEIIDLVEQGRFEEAALITQNQEANHVFHLEEHIQKLKDFAGHKADEFFTQAEQTRNMHLLFLSALILLIFGLCLAGGFWLTRSITDPLARMVETIRQIRSGNLDQRINLPEKDEIGLLAGAFDNLTAHLQTTMVSCNELNAANQQLEAANQQLQAANHQIQASEQQLKASNQQLIAGEQQLRAANQQLNAINQELSAANQQLQLQESQLRGLGHILETSLNEIYVFHAQTLRFIEVNKGARENTGYTIDELRQMTPLDIEPNYTQEAFDLLLEPLQTGEKQIIEFKTVLQRKDGTRYAADVHLQKSSLNNTPVYVAVILDITDSRKAEQERERLMRILEAKNQELQDIIYVSSHDLKTPLVTINGFSDMLAGHCRQIKELVGTIPLPEKIRTTLNQLIDEEIPEDAAFITAGAQKMRTLLDGLLKVSRIGASTVRPTRIDMNKIIQLNLDAAAFTIQSLSARVTVDNHLPACIADADQISQVISNLLDNALKYADPARTPKIRFSGQQKSGQSIYTVQDNGIGIRPDYFEKVFEIFHRLDPKKTIDGEGLGLTIVRRILDMHNGKIWIESTPGKGSKFIFSLPSKEDS